MTTVLDDAKLVSNHARKRTIDVDDIKLAVQVKIKQAHLAFSKICFRI